MHDARVFRKADVGLDHYLVRTKIKLKLQNQGQPIPKRLFTTEKLKDHAIAGTFALELSNHLDFLGEVANGEEIWKNLKDTTREHAQNIIGTCRRRRREQWIHD